MKKGTSIIGVTAAFAAMAAPAIAAGGGEDSSHIVIWAFLSFCALIIVSQLIPVISNLMDARKAAKKKAQELDAAAEKGRETHVGYSED